MIVSLLANFQPTALWGGSGPFDVDPFGQQIQTPTDPFAGSDPFGEDPFAMKSGGSGGGGGGGAVGGSNPFGSAGGRDLVFGGPGGWKPDGGADQKQKRQS